MTHSIVITEDKTDVAILRSILDVSADDPSVVFMAAGSYSSADSLARSALLRGGANVALVVDADTNDLGRVAERRQFLEESLHSIASSSRSQIFIIVPEIASLLFQDRQVIESFIGQPITDIDLIRGQFEPRNVLNALSQGQPVTSVIESRLPFMDLSPLRQIPVIAKLQHFLYDPVVVA